MMNMLNLQSGYCNICGTWGGSCQHERTGDERMPIPHKWMASILDQCQHKGYDGYTDCHKPGVVVRDGRNYCARHADPRR
jgi:hypothetical protein